MNRDIDLTAIMRRDGIASIHNLPRGLGFRVELTCGGPCGYGDTVGKALADAKAKNADFLPRIAA